jgi:hypothetical protein
MQRPPLPRRRSITTDRRGVTAVEMAIVLPVFMAFLLMLFEVAYDQFLQGALESTLQYTAYQVQVGLTENAANGKDSKTFIDQQLCKNSIGHLLGCGSLWVRVQQYNASTCSDYYSETVGALPIASDALQLGDYAGEAAPNGANKSVIGPSNCTVSGGGAGFCNPGPNEYIIMSAIYIAPSFLYALFPGEAYTYGGHFVHAAFASTAFYTEGYPALPTGIPAC